jgi:hypothetical protein
MPNPDVQSRETPGGPIPEAEWIEAIYGKRPTSSDSRYEYDRRVADFRAGRAYGERVARRGVARA